MAVLISDIPEDLHALVEIVGMDNFLEISKLYGGSNLYIPVYYRVVMGERNRQILELYNGKNIDKLRVKFSLSEHQIKNLIKNKNN